MTDARNHSPVAATSVRVLHNCVLGVNGVWKSTVTKIRED